MSRLLRLLAAAALLETCAFGADPRESTQTPNQSDLEQCGTAVLRNGFTIAYSRHEGNQDTVTLWLCHAGGTAYLTIPVDQIQGFEQPEPAPPPTPTSLVTEVAPLRSDTHNPIRDVVDREARRHQIDPDFLASVIDAESRFNPSAVSPKGALGLMQLMPRTAVSLGVQNALDPAQNVEGGTKYLRQLLDQYHWDAVKALAAYNAGPEKVEQYGGIPPYRETRAYIARVIQEFNRKKQQAVESPATNPVER
jgi:hypothetical protein